MKKRFFEEQIVKMIQEHKQGKSVSKISRALKNLTVIDPVSKVAPRIVPALSMQGEGVADFFWGRTKFSHLNHHNKLNYLYFPAKQKLSTYLLNTSNQFPLYISLLQSLYRHPLFFFQLNY